MSYVMPTWPRVECLGVDHIGAPREACVSRRNHEDALSREVDSVSVVAAATLEDILATACWV
jgi:hypothetical protein